MPNMLTGLFAGNWSDDPALNARGQMGGLGAAAALLNTHGKTGGQLLSGAVQGYMGGMQQERMTQLKEQDTYADIAYKRAMAGRSQQEFAGKINDMAMKLYELDYSMWQRAGRAAEYNGQQFNAPPPSFEQSQQKAMQAWAGASTTGRLPLSMGGTPMPQPQGAAMGAPPMSGPQPGPQSAPQPQPEPPGMGGGYGMQPKSSAPGLSPGGGMGLQAPDPSMQRLPQIGPAAPPQPIGTHTPTPGGEPMQQLAGPGGQGSASPAQMQMQKLGRLITSYFSGGDTPPKELVQAYEALGGKLDPGYMRDPSSGLVIGTPGAKEAMGERANYEGINKTGLEMYLADQRNKLSAGQSYATELGQQKAKVDTADPLNRAQTAANMMQVPGAGPNDPPTLRTLGQVRSAAGSPDAQPGQPGAAPGAGGGIPIGMTPDAIKREARRGDIYKDSKEAFASVYKDAMDSQASANEVVRTVDGMRRTMPQSTGKWDEFAQPAREWFAATVGLSPASTEQVYRAQGFTGLANQGLIATQKDFKGSVSNIEVKTAEKTIARIGNHPKANEFILDFKELSAKKNIWFAQEVGKIQNERNAAIQAGQDFDLDARINALNRLSSSPEMSIFRSARMQQWN